MNITPKIFIGALMLVSNLVVGQETVTRKLSGFSRLSVSGSFDVALEQGSEESVKIVAEGVSAEKVISEVKNGRLDLRMEYGHYEHFKVKVYLVYKQLEGIDKSGSGNLNGSSDLSGQEFRINSSGSGNIILNGVVKARQVRVRSSGSGNVKIGSLEADEAELSFSGSGDIEIKGGYVKKQSIEMSGSGNVSAFGLKSDECMAAIAGSGDVDVQVNQVLEGRIAGSGNINYMGDPAVKKGGIIGSGRINRKS